jgi:hypothetical protein
VPTNATLIARQNFDPKDMSKCVAVFNTRNNDARFEAALDENGNIFFR